MNPIPADTLITMELLNLSVDEFSRIHHFGSSASVERHRDYLSSKIKEYRPGGTNETVASRLQMIEDSIKNGGGRNAAIAKAIEAYPMPKTRDD